MNRQGLKDGTRNQMNRPMVYFEIESPKDSEDPIHIIEMLIIIKHITFESARRAASNNVNSSHGDDQSFLIKKEFPYLFYAFSFHRGLFYSSSL